MAKTIEEHFRDWESYAFGYGYGTGELHIIPALRRFLNLCDERSVSHQYDYRQLEAALTPTVAWLLINALCEAEIVEYGTSPRHGWLTDEGKRLREFVRSRTDGELIHLVTEWGDDYAHCCPEACNCGPKGYEDGKACDNPFWPSRR